MSKLNKLFLLLSLSLIFTNYVGAQTINTLSLNFREKILERTQERIQVQNATNTTSTQVKLRNLEELRQQMQVKIQEIKDENKKRIAQNLVSQMERINKRLSENHLKYLDIVEKALNKIEERVKNLTTTDETIILKTNELKIKIANLRSKIEAQMQKEYLVQIQTETKLREAYQTTKKELMNDHKNLRQELQALKKEVRDLFLKLNPTNATTTNATSSN